MEYLTSKETAQKWGISQCRVIGLARTGRIEGAVLINRKWMIPEDAPKPADGRKLRKKETEQKSVFRFPFYMNLPEDSFLPPLTKEERLLRQAQIDFYACDFKKTVNTFETLSENAESIYVRICALFYMCALCAVYDENIDCQKYYSLFNLAFEKDFPYKKEMQALSSLLCIHWGYYKTAADKLIIDQTYDYHPSVCYLLEYLTFYHIPYNESYEKANFNNVVPRLNVYEPLCKIMEQDQHYYEAISVHLLLYTFYNIANFREYALHHLKAGLRIAKDHNLLYLMADQEPYFHEYYDQLREEFSADFMEKLHQYGLKLSDRFALFQKKHGKVKAYGKLSPADIQMLYFVDRKYSNKEIAKITHLSERTIANKFAAIYEKLGVQGRQELLEMYQDAINE